MQLKTFVKASKINNLSDARYFAAFSVHWMGFDCNPISTNYLPIAKIKEIAQWVSGPLISLNVSGLSAQDIEHLITEINADGIELEASQSLPSHIHGKKVFRKILVTKETTIHAIRNQMTQEADYFILDFESSNMSIQAFLADEYQLKTEELSSLVHSLLLDANINAEQSDQILQLPIDGLVIRGGNEEKIGVRSFEDVQDLMDELEIL